MDITRLPEILMIHLKRFDFVNGQLSKVEDMVNFPLKKFNLSNYISNINADSKNSYDCYGVWNHIQFSVAGGHYTSYINYDSEEFKRTNPTIGDKWNKWNDDLISEAKVSEIINKNAFILFYKRNEFNPSNIVDFLAF